MDKAALTGSNLIGFVGKSDSGEDMYSVFDPVAQRIVAVCDGEWHTVFRSTSLVHKHIETTLRSLDELQGVLTDAGADDFAATVDTIASGLALAQRVALHGVETVMADMERNRRRGL